MERPGRISYPTDTDVRFDLDLCDGITQDDGTTCNNTECCGENGNGVYNGYGTLTCDCDDGFCGTAYATAGFNVETIVGGNACDLIIDVCGNCNGECSGEPGSVVCADLTYTNDSDCAGYCCDGSCDGDDAYTDSCGVCVGRNT